MSRFVDISVGDKVILPDGRDSPGRVAIVEKTTKTQFTAGGARWLKDGGSQVGRAREWWHPRNAYPATPELIEACENYRVLGRLVVGCGRHLAVIQGQLVEATRAKNKGDQLKLIEYLGRVAATLETISPPVEQ